MKAFYLRFAKVLYDTAERSQKLPNKFIDTRFVLLFQVIFCPITYSAIVTAQMRVVDNCVFPLPSSFIIK
jgi:hypothetical protein